jgi:mannosyl-oligosaccharide alpha-1,2-mannosidase
MARRSSSSSSSGAWWYLNPAYYLKRPKRLALLFFVFVAATFAFWDRQSLVSEYEVRPLSPATGNSPLIQVGTSGI